MISKMISAFEPLFIGILVTIYVVLFSYIIASGVNVVKGNKEEIGIYKALGGKFINIGKVLLLDILVTGILIISISLIATPIVLDLANDILVKSFETVLTVKIFHLDVIRTFVDVLSVNFSTLFAAIILSAIVPALWLFTLKPIQIIKE
jgi:ABC-type lipoprotein release transport system permease subunit